MSDNPSESRGVDFSIIDTHKLKRPFHILSLPPAYFSEIGKVATAWGTFDTIFEAFLVALLSAAGPQAGWKGLTFRKKRILFTDRMKIALARCPTARAQLHSVLDDIEPLYKKRNLAVHGRMLTRIEVFDRDDGTKEVRTRLVCKGYYKGAEVQEVFTIDELDDLFYEIAHLNGRLNRVALGFPDHAPEASPEIQTLRDFLSNNHPTYPNPATQPRQLQPSEVSVVVTPGRLPPPKT